MDSIELRNKHSMDGKREPPFLRYYRFTILPATLLMELSLCHKLEYSIPIIYATWRCKP